MIERQFQPDDMQRWRELQRQIEALPVEAEIGYRSQPLPRWLAPAWDTRAPVYVLPVRGLTDTRCIVRVDNIVLAVRQ